eukprot:3418209-Rhodomonas_salina.2
MSECCPAAAADAASWCRHQAAQDIDSSVRKAAVWALAAIAPRGDKAVIRQVLRTTPACAFAVSMCGRLRMHVEVAARRR